MAMLSTLRHAEAVECFGFNTTMVSFLVRHGFDTEVTESAQTELADMRSLSFVNSTFFTNYLVTYSH